MKFLQKIKAFVLKEQFNPWIIGFFINFLYYGRKALFEHIKQYSPHINGKILDIWCWSKPYKDLFKNTESYVWIDVVQSWHNHRHSKVDKHFNGKDVPYNDDEFDNIVIFEVIEHVFEIDHLLNEMKRVLRKNWQILATIPFVWDEHEIPYDFARYSSFGLRHLFERHGFEVIKTHKYLNNGQLFALLINNYFYKLLERYVGSKIAFIMMIPIWTCINTLWLIFWIFPKSDNFYFWNIILLKNNK